MSCGDKHGFAVVRRLVFRPVFLKCRRTRGIGHDKRNPKIVSASGFDRVGILSVLVLMMIPAVARVSATKPPPPTGSSFAKAYSVPYSYSVAESISQASSGGFVVGGLCSDFGTQAAHGARSPQKRTNETVQRALCGQNMRPGLPKSV